MRVIRFFLIFLNVGHLFSASEELLDDKRQRRGKKVSFLIVEREAPSHEKDLPSNEDVNRIEQLKQELLWLRKMKKHLKHSIPLV